MVSLAQALKPHRCEWSPASNPDSQIPFLAGVLEPVLTASHGGIFFVRTRWVVCEDKMREFMKTLKC